MTDTNAIVEKYLQLRDRKAELKANYEESVRELDAAMEKVENYLLKLMNQQGLEALPTAAGTAYKSTRTSAQVADWDAILEHIKSTENWAMLERRVSKAVVQQYMDENNDLPPGINWRAETTVNIRRS